MQLRRAAASKYSFIFNTDFLRIIHVSETEDRYNSIMFSHSSNCHTVCAEEQTFASIPSVCFHNKYSYMIRHGSSINPDLDTKGNSITCHCTRWAFGCSVGECQQMKTPINFDSIHPIHQHTSWSHLSLGLKMQGATQVYLWSDILSEKQTLYSSHTLQTEPGLLNPTVWLNKCITNVPVHS